MAKQERKVTKKVVVDALEQINRNAVLALFVVGKSESPIETLKKGGLKRLVAQWNSLVTLDAHLPLDLSPA